MISYIYAYEGGVKGKNTGYAKVEVRGGICRLQVSVKKVFVGGNDIGVYLLAPGTELLVGRIFIRGGAGEFRTQLNAVNVDGSGLSMDECYGLTVHDVESAWQSYTTIWEDAVAQAAEVQLADVTAENRRKQEKEETAEPVAKEASGDPALIRFPISAEIERELEEEARRLEATAPWEREETEPVTDGTGGLAAERTGDEAGREAGWENGQEAAEAAAGGAAEAAAGGIAETRAGEAVEAMAGGIAETTAGETGEATAGEPAEAMAAGRQELAAEQKPEQVSEQILRAKWAQGAEWNQMPEWSQSPDQHQVPDQNRELRQERETAQAAEESPDGPKGDEVQAAGVVSEGTAGRGDWTDSRLEADTGNGAEEGPAPGASSRSDAAQIPEPEDLEVLRELDKREEEDARRNSLWDRLQRQYTKVLAFDYDNECEILSIKPQDIGVLPREIWVYGNNSFLLHGYYNYRHLILARLGNSQGRSRYLLGVPGHYFSNEKHLAAMFGFPHFVLAKKQPEEDGRFGYWYTDIRL